MRYREKRGRKWIVMVIFTLLIGIAGWFIMPNLYMLTKSSYDRRGIEKICEEMFGDVRLENVITKDVNIVAFDYNSFEPRIFSKTTAIMNKEKYAVKVAEASEASSAAPIYFDPKVIGD